MKKGKGNYSDDYIIEKSNRKQFGIFYFLIVLVLITTVIAVTGVFFGYW